MTVTSWSVSWENIVPDTAQSAEQLWRLLNRLWLDSGQSWPLFCWFGPLGALLITYCLLLLLISIIIRWLMETNLGVRQCVHGSQITQCDQHSQLFQFVVTLGPANWIELIQLEVGNWKRTSDRQTVRQTNRTNDVVVDDTTPGLSQKVGLGLVSITSVASGQSAEWVVKSTTESAMVSSESRE